MRLSGNYFERLLIVIAPYPLIGVTMIMAITGEDIKTGIVIFLLLTIALWLMDTITIFLRFNNPRTLRITTKLLYGKRVILPKDIVSITRVTDMRQRLTLKLIEFSLANGSNFMVIDKPQTFFEDMFDRPSKTLSRLFKEYPELQSKLEDEKFLHWRPFWKRNSY